jgi:hypothetical protein
MVGTIAGVAADRAGNRRTSGQAGPATAPAPVRKLVSRQQFRRTFPRVAALSPTTQPGSAQPQIVPTDPNAGRLAEQYARSVGKLSVRAEHDHGTMHSAPTQAAAPGGPHTLGKSASPAASEPRSVYIASVRLSSNS